MAAHTDLTHSSPIGAWRLRLHQDGRVEVLEHRRFGQTVLEHAAPPPPAPPKPAEHRGCHGCAALLRKLAGGIKLAAVHFGVIGATPEPERQARQAACLACDFHDFGVCTSCSCVLWAKVRVAGEQCPESRWTGLTVRASEGLCAEPCADIPPKLPGTTPDSEVG